MEAVLFTQLRSWVRRPWPLAVGVAVTMTGSLGAQAPAPPAARLLAPRAIPTEPTGTVRSAPPDAKSDLTPVSAHSGSKSGGKKSGLFDGIVFFPDSSIPGAPNTPTVAPPPPLTSAAPASLAPTARSASGSSDGIRFFPDSAMPVSAGTPSGSPFTSAAPVPARPKSTLDSTWDEVKDLFSGKPSPPSLNLPATHPVGMQANGGPGTPGASQPAVYAGPPAYRWFGWGTTTPGSNPYAPQGLYPRGSANWYAQTGATPGAFPTPVVNPFRPSPGSEPPVYLGSGVPPTTDAFGNPTPPPMVTSNGIPPASSPAQTPAPRQPDYQPHPMQYPVTRSVPTMAEPPQPIAESVPAAPRLPTGPGTPITEFPVTPPSVAPPPTNDPQWQPAGGTLPTATQSSNRATTPGGVVQVSAVAPNDLETLIRSACNGLVGGVSVRSDAPGRLIVRFVAPSDAHARAAAHAVSKVEAIRGYEVRFEARVPAP